MMNIFCNSYYGLTIHNWLFPGVLEIAANGQLFSCRPFWDCFLLGYIKASLPFQGIPTLDTEYIFLISSFSNRYIIAHSPFGGSYR